jgi:hypothetical protein
MKLWSQDGIDERNLGQPAGLHLPTAQSKAANTLQSSVRGGHVGSAAKASRTRQSHAVRSSPQLLGDKSKSVSYLSYSKGGRFGVDQSLCKSDLQTSNTECRLRI